MRRRNDGQTQAAIVRRQDRRFAGALAFVTGPGGGAGRAAALAFVREGASVVVADDARTGTGPRWSRPARRLHGLVLALLATVSLPACGGADEDASLPAAAPDARDRAPAPSTSPASDDPVAGGSDGIPIRITVGDTHLTARLHDIATARDLAAQLPLALTFRDLNGVEKTAPLPRKLSVEGAPKGDDPEVGDIGYWARDGDLVLYYGDVGFWNGIVRIGHFDGEMDAIERQSQDFEATIERA